MKLNEQEKTLLVWANCKHKTPGQEIEFGKLGLTAQEWDSAIERLNALGLVDAISVESPPPRWHLTKITADGRLAASELNSRTRAKLARVLVWLIGSVVVPALVAGATAYYTSWLAVNHVVKQMGR